MTEFAENFHEIWRIEEELYLLRTCEVRLHERLEVDDNELAHDLEGLVNVERL
jgi:hypothetical protein